VGLSGALILYLTIRYIRDGSEPSTDDAKLLSLSKWRVETDYLGSKSLVDTRQILSIEAYQILGVR
jgi:hypothetical protein